MSERKWDTFCWKCHRPSYDEVKCSKCDLSFHKNCITDQNRSKPGWLCPECKLLAETGGKRNVKVNNLDGLLKLCVERVRQKSGHFAVPDEYLASRKLVNPITFEQIRDKAENSGYTSANELLLDFKWLRHNCNILKLYSKKDEENAKKVWVQTLRKVKLLYSQCEAEVNDLTLCGECYVRVQQAGAFEAACTPPHLVLWVKYRTYPYWPAKLFKIHASRKRLEVHFFNEYNWATVSYDDCFLYSKEDPNVYLTDQYKASIRVAAEEANRYIQNVENKFGPVQLPSTFIKPMPGTLDMHLKNIIPGFANVANDFENINIPQQPTINPSNDNVQVTSVAPKHVSITVTSSFLERVQQCREYIATLKANYQSQTEELNRSRVEIESLKKAVIHAKSHSWCTNCLQQIESDHPRSCENCGGPRLTSVEQDMEIDHEF